MDGCHWPRSIYNGFSGARLFSHHRFVGFSKARAGVITLNAAHDNRGIFSFDCKAKFVLSVKKNISSLMIGRFIFFYNMDKNSLILLILFDLFEIMVDISSLTYIIIFTLQYWRFRDVKTKNTKRKRDAQSTTSKSERSLISGERFLRFQRFVASQIRNVTQSLQGWLGYFKSSQNIRFFKTLFLQSLFCLSSKRVGWPTLSKKGAKRTSQINSHGCQSYQKTFIQKSPVNSQRIIPASHEKIFFIYTSAKYRARFKVTEKKTLTKPNQNSLLEPNIVERYEALRIEILKPNSSLPYGYSFFINKGLLAWCRYHTSTQEECFDYKRNDKKPVSEVLVSEKTVKPIVEVLTNMIIQIQQESSYGM